MKNYSNKEYYKNCVADPNRQFDLIETTISHLFRFPHPALQGLSYGAAFCKQVLERELLTNDHKVIIEVGGGLGDFAHDFLTQLYKEQVQLPYIVLDISSELQKRQKDTLKDFPNVYFHLADAQQQPFQEQEIQGLVISNEVIADFDSVEFSAEEWSSSQDPDIQFLHNVVSVPKEKTLFNVGSINFIKNLYRILAPKSTAIIIEHGLWEDSRVTLTGRPTSPETSHFEFSINWSHIYHLAKNLGFSCEIEALIDFLSFDKEVEVANLNDSRALNKVDPNFPIAAIPASLLYQIFEGADIRSSAGLRLPKVGAEGFPDDNTLPFYQSFQTLILKKIKLIDVVLV
ncbi:MAG: SAM-dependent methyltransferase [Blastocatellia bacterium]